MKDPRFPKLVIFVNSSVPLALLLWDAYWHHLGANPVDYAIHTTGELALIFLVISLTITPVRKITGWNWLSHFRRMLGLFAFAYGCIHFIIYFAFDRSFSLSATLADIIKHKYIFFGLTALLLMVPLALTSTNASIKCLGAAKWKQLHRLVYPAAIAAVLHYYLLVKADITQPVIFATILALLFAYRLLSPHLNALKAPPKIARST